LHWSVLPPKILDPIDCAAFVRVSLAVAQIAQPDSSLSPARILPLNRFPDSCLTGDEQGFYQMPTGIGDDYFDGTDSVMRIRRHMKIARALGVKYLRCAYSWNGIEHEQGQYSWGFWDRLVIGIGTKRN
jgi:hypothetical protein